MPQGEFICHQVVLFFGAMLIIALVPGLAVFDECILYFGQNRISLAGYTTLQVTISTVLSNERSRI
jgi:hypothetical protein